jgi:hypothetical protein
MKKLLLFILTLMVFACADEFEPEKSEKTLNQDVVGSWRFAEFGYSPGDKYYVEAVSPLLFQTITFKDDSTMSSTNMQLEKFKYYRILKDTLYDGEVIAFLEEDPGKKKLDLATLSPTYSIKWEEDDLFLNYRWCYEGCHMKFKRIAK